MKKFVLSTLACLIANQAFAATNTVSDTTTAKTAPATKAVTKKTTTKAASASTAAATAKKTTTDSQTATKAKPLLLKNRKQPSLQLASHNLPLPPKSPRLLRQLR